MIKLVCISNGVIKESGTSAECGNGIYLYLTIGKIYNAVGYVNTNYYNWYQVCDDFDNHTTEYYEKELFITLAEYRDKQLEEILND